MLLKIRILLIVSGLTSVIWAQSDPFIDDQPFDNKINSPYSRFGLGDFYSVNFSPGKAMGGTAIGLAIPNTINISNPASYISQDTLSFIFDIGIRSDLLSLSSTQESLETNNANIDHIAIAFPIGKKWSGSMGLIPYSKTGYNIQGNYSMPDSSDVVIRKGQGELNRIYFGSAVHITNSLSFGLNMYYVFGKRNELKSLEIIDREADYRDGTALRYYEKNESFTKGFIFNTGLQYSYTFNENKLIVGLTYQPN